MINKIISMMLVFSVCTNINPYFTKQENAASKDIAVTHAMSYDKAPYVARKEKAEEKEKKLTLVSAVNIDPEILHEATFVKEKHKGYYLEWISEIFNKEISLTDEEYTLLCHTVHEEAGNQSVEAQRLCAVAILMRLGRDDFPKTLTEVIYQEDGKQFNVVSKPGFPDAYEITEETREAVYLAIATYPKEPVEMVFFRSKHYFEGLRKYTNKGDMYFSLSKKYDI